MDESVLDAIYNYRRLSDRIATAGRPTIEQLSAIRSAGYDVIINLLPDDYEGVAEEQEAVTMLGITYVQIPVFWTEPQFCDLETFFAAMDSHADKRIFVHCAANMRASAFMYLYRVLRDGAPQEVAQQDLHLIWAPNPIWQRFIDRAVHRFAEIQAPAPIAE